MSKQYSNKISNVVYYLVRLPPLTTEKFLFKALENEILYCVGLCLKLYKQLSLLKSAFSVGNLV